MGEPHAQRNKKIIRRKRTNNGESREDDKDNDHKNGIVAIRRTKNAPRTMGIIANEIKQIGNW